jgi:hypothetical protein
MNSNPTTLRDLPAARLAARKEHLLSEISGAAQPTVFARWRRRSLIAAAAAVVTVTVGASALAYRYLGPSPGFSAGVSAFERLPRAEWPMSRIGLEHAAAAVELTPEEAEQRLRLLRSGLRMGPGRSEGKGDLYAFPGRNGTACMFLTGQGGGCVTPDAVDFVRSAMGMVFPGYPGQTMAAVGVVADNVRSVEVVAREVRWSPEIVNNSF